MRRLFLRPEQLAAAGAQGLVALDQAQERHLAVLRLAEGAQVEAFDGQGARHAMVLEGRGLRHVQRLAEQAGRGLEVWLGQALSKADKLELVLQKATELGAVRVLPFAADRGVVKLVDERAGHKLARWTRIAQEAARQCGRADVPVIEAPCALDELLARAGAEEDLRVIALDTSELPLTLSQAARGAGRLLLLVGPEGGFSPRERALFEEHNVLVATLGALILRTETAGLAALAVVRHVAGELG